MNVSRKILEKEKKKNKVEGGNSWKGKNGGIARRESGGPQSPVRQKIKGRVMGWKSRRKTLRGLL